MSLTPALLLCLLSQPAYQATFAEYAAVQKRLDDWRTAKDWAAIAAYCQAMPLPQRAGYLYPWLDALQRGGHWDKVLAICEDPAYKAYVGNPGLLAVLDHFKGRALSELGRKPEALAWQMARARRGDTLTYLAAWNEALALADWPKALECAQGLVDKYPANGDYLGMQGEALAKLTRYKEAEKTLVEALHLAPKRAMSWADLSCCCNEGARYEEALEAGAKAIALDPKLLEGWCNRGRAHMGLKQYQEGRDDYAAALALGPKDPALVANLQMNLAMADKYLAFQRGKRSGKP